MSRARKNEKPAGARLALEDDIERERTQWQAKRDQRGGGTGAGAGAGEEVTYEQLVAKQSRSNVESLQSSLQKVVEAQKIGADTLVQLQMQREQLLRVDDDLHQINCSLGRSEKHLRAIKSIRGSVTNMLYKPIQEIDNRFRGKSSTGPSPSPSPAPTSNPSKGKNPSGGGSGKGGDSGWGEDGGSGGGGGEVLEIPEYIHTGDDIEKLKITDSLRAKGVAMGQGPNGQTEIILYHYCNSAKAGFMVRDETSDCVVLTNMRLLKVEDSALKIDIPLRRVKEVSLDRSKVKVRYEQLIVTMVDGDQWGEENVGKVRKESVGIWNSDAATFYYKILNKVVADLAQRRGTRTIDQLDQEAQKREAALNAQKKQLFGRAPESGTRYADGSLRNGGGGGGSGRGMDGEGRSGVSQLEKDFDAARQQEDEMLDVLHGALQELGSQANALNTELKDQDKLIEHVGEQMDKTNARLDRNIRTTDKILGKDKATYMPKEKPGDPAAAAADRDRKQELESRRDAIRKKLGK